jgi:hypothetical protein
MALATSPLQTYQQKNTRWDRINRVYTMPTAQALKKKFSKDPRVHRVAMILMDYMDKRDLGKEFHCTNSVIAKEYGCSKWHATRLVKAVLDEGLFTVSAQFNKITRKWDRRFTATPGTIAVARKKLMISEVGMDAASNTLQCGAPLIGSPLSGIPDERSEPVLPDDSWLPSKEDQDWFNSNDGGGTRGNTGGKPPHHKKKKRLGPKKKRTRKAKKADVSAEVVLMAQRLFGEKGYNFRSVNKRLDKLIKLIGADIEAAEARLRSNGLGGFDKHESLRRFNDLCCFNGI